MFVYQCHRVKVKVKVTEAKRVNCYPATPSMTGVWGSLTATAVTTSPLQSFEVWRYMVSYLQPRIAAAPTGKRRRQWRARPRPLPLRFIVADLVIGGKNMLVQARRQDFTLGGGAQKLRGCTFFSEKLTTFFTSSLPAAGPYMRYLRPTEHFC